MRDRPNVNRGRVEGLLGPQAAALDEACQNVGDQLEHGHAAGDGHESMTSTRSAEHRGKAIVIRTHYEITVDGEPVFGHFEVDDEGRVHGHGLPNYAFSSALELVKRLIDASENVVVEPDELAHVYEDD